MSMPKLICVTHQRELVPAENGVNVIELANFGPFRIWQTDQWSCPHLGCPVQIAPEAGARPIEHYQAGFRERLAWALELERRALLRLDFESDEQEARWLPLLDQWVAIFNQTHP
jgi:hypothetical protein